LDEARQILTHQRFTASETDLLDTELNRESGQARNFLERKDFLFVDPFIVIEGHTISAAKITPIGHRDP
jgi:hypothetical protein